MMYKRRVPHNDVGEKWCGGCHEFHPLACFDVRNASWDGLRAQCRVHVAQQQKISGIRRKYGLTVDEYEDIMSSGCGICGAPAHHLDHCHASGNVRAALCRACNMALGLFQDDPARMRAAAAYVERFQ